MTMVALAVWTLLTQLASRVGLLEAYEVASAAVVLALLGVLALLVRRRPETALLQEGAPAPAPGAAAIAAPAPRTRPRFRRRHLAHAGRA